MKEIILNRLKNCEQHLSGEQLSQEMGVTRAAVWKAVQTLRQDGYEIEAVRNRGYKLISDGDVLTRNEVLQALEKRGVPDLIDRVTLVEAVDSTNRLARTMAEQGAPDLSFFIAERQTAGRGRRGRTWLSDSREGLWLSILLRPDQEASRMAPVTLFAGLSVALALKSLGVPTGIKWPNDLIGQKSKRKLGGILTEMTAEETAVTSLVIGIGINVGSENFPDEIENIATSAYLESGRRIRRADMLAAIIQTFCERYPAFLEHDWLSDYKDNCLTLNREVQVISPDGSSWQGQAIDLDDAGELVVLDAAGQRHVVRSGEVSVRGLFGYI